MRFSPFLILILAPSVSLAQESRPPLTVDAAVALAIKGNPRLSAAAREVAAARLGVRSARSPSNPEIVVTPGLSVGGSDEVLLVRQPLEINGAREARTGVASAELHRTESLSVVELRNLVFETKSAYYDLARARQQRDVAVELLKTAEEFDRLIRRQVELGRRPGIDLAQTGIEVTRAEQQLALADRDVLIAESALNTLMGRPARNSIGAVALPEFVPESVDPDASRRQAENRAEIAAEQAGADVFRQEARLARAEGRPDLAPHFRATSITRGFSDKGVGIGITLPLFDYGSRRHRIKQADNSARAQEDRAEAARYQARVEVEQALARLRAAESTVVRYREGILDRARRLLDGARTLFIEGAERASILTVLEAQRTFRSVQTEYNNALADYAQARAEIERATAAVPASLVPVRP